MEETKHTPGPWIVTEYDGKGPMEVQSTENPGATLALVYAEHFEQIGPNAELIARAPELLKENERLRTALEKALKGAQETDYLYRENSRFFYNSLCQHIDFIKKELTPTNDGE